MISKMQSTLAMSRDSPSTTIPNSAVPAAPMPVHTAYPVPMGIVFSDSDRNTKLTAMQATVAIEGPSREKPCVYFNPIAQPISSNPAMTK